jgi:hypothetical protein
MTGDMEHLAVEPENKCRDSTTQRDSVPRDRVKDGLAVRRRPADHPQDRARRRLLLECFRQSALQIRIRRR